jgi:adenylylsulfate kinase
VSADEIHPVHDRLLGRADQEALLGQRGQVAWLYGLSGSGKSTIAAAVQRALHAEGRLVQVLDGDNIRAGLNRNLGFSDEDRRENIRRIAEVARLFVDTGTVVLASFITPLREFRARAREIVGAEDFLEVYVRASFEECARRDVKGIYGRAAAGKVARFSGKDSAFEEPEEPDLLLDTERATVEESVNRLLAVLRERIRR